VSTPEQIKSCCAAAYSSDAVAWVLGENYHPGGVTLTRRLADLLQVRAGQQVLDVAAGRGATAQRLAAEYGVTVDGVDLADEVVDRAQLTANRAGLGATVRFHRGDAERLPLPDKAFDAAISECAFCTFPDKDTAAAEFARVLRSGGKLGLADVTVAAEGLPAALTTLTGWVACIADARPLGDYVAILEGAGLRTRHTESHDGALLTMIDKIEARVTLARLIRAPWLADTGVDTDEVLTYVERVRCAVTDGLLGYVLLTAEKP
jgi:arsenite methyltransferase